MIATVYWLTLYHQNKYRRISIKSEFLDHCIPANFRVFESNVFLLPVWVKQGLIAIYLNSQTVCGFLTFIWNATSYNTTFSASFVVCSWIQSGTSAGHLLRYTLNVCFWQPLDITPWQPSKWSSKIHNLRMKQPFLYEIDFGIRSDVIMINGRLSWLSQHEEPEAAWKCFHCTPGCRCTLLENHCAMTSSLITIFQRRDVDRLKYTTAFWRTILFWLLYERSCLAWRMKMWEECDFFFFPFSLEKSWAPVWINCT